MIHDNSFETKNIYYNHNQHAAKYCKEQYRIHIFLKIAETKYGFEITEPTTNVTKAFDDQIMSIIEKMKTHTIALLWHSHCIFIEIATLYHTIFTAS